MANLSFMEAGSSGRSLPICMSYYVATSLRQSKRPLADPSLIIYNGSGKTRRDLLSRILDATPHTGTPVCGNSAEGKAGVKNEI